MSWFGILKQRPFTAEELEFHGGQRNAEQVRRAKEAQLAEQYRTQVQGQQAMPGYVKDPNQRETIFDRGFRNKEGQRTLGTRAKDAVGNVGMGASAGLAQVTTKLPQNVGRAMDIATAPVFKPIQTARKVGSTIDRATGGAAGRVTKPVREGVSGAVSGAAKLGRNIARGSPFQTSRTGVPTNRFTGNKMGTEEIMEQFDTGSYAGRETEFAGRKLNPETGMWEKPGKDDVYELTAADREYNKKRKDLENKIRDPKTTSDQREAYQIQLDDLMDSGASGTQRTTSENYTRAGPSKFFNQLLYGDRKLTTAGKKKLDRIKSERAKAKENKT